MDRVLQGTLLIASIFFFFYIIKMVNKGKLQLQYTITWIFVALCFIILSIFPGIMFFIAELLHIETPSNAIFLFIISFLLITIFTLTRAISLLAMKVKDLTQELGIMKNEINKDKNND